MFGWHHCAASKSCSLTLANRAIASLTSYRPSASVLAGNSHSHTARVRSAATGSNLCTITWSLVNDRSSWGAAPSRRTARHRRAAGRTAGAARSARAARTTSGRGRSGSRWGRSRRCPWPGAVTAGSPGPARGGWGAVIALLEVLVNQLPVRRHVVLGPAADPQLADPVALQLGVAAQPGPDLRAHMVLQRTGAAVHAHPDQVLPDLRPSRVQAVASLVDIGHRPPVRRGDQRTVQAVDPVVIRAVDRVAGLPASVKHNCAPRCRHTLPDVHASLGNAQYAAYV